MQGVKHFPGESFGFTIDTLDEFNDPAKSPEFQFPKNFIFLDLGYLTIFRACVLYIKKNFSRL